PDFDVVAHQELPIRFRTVSSPGAHNLIALIDGESGLVSIEHGRDHAKVADFQSNSESGAPSLSFDGHYCCVSSTDKLSVWRIEADKAILVISQLSANHPVFAPDNRHIAYIDSAGHVQLYDLKTEQHLRQLAPGF